MIQLLIIFFLILINGLLAASELAVVSSRTTRLQTMAAEGVTGAAKAARLADSPSHFLSAVQIGISMVGILAGAFGGATVAHAIAEVVQDWPLIGAYSNAVGVGTIVLFTTYLSLVVGELTPKRLALRNPERIASLVAPAMHIVATVTGPVVHILNRSSDFLLYLFGQTSNPDNEVSTDEIKLLIEEGRESGAIDPREEEMINRIFRLADRQVKVLMTPRLSVAWLDLQANRDELRNLVTQSGYSRYPVAEGSLDNIQGIALAKDILAYCVQDKPIDLHNILRPALYVPESMSPLQVIERFKATQSKIAVVIDEYGGVEGITTVDDVMEAIVGDIPDRSDEQDAPAARKENGAWLIDAQLALDEFQALLEIPSLPEDAGRKYQTVGGLVMDVLGEIPRTGDMFRWQNVQVRIEKMDGRRVEQVAVVRDEEPDDAQGSE